MFSIHFTRLKCDYLREVYEAIRRHRDLCLAHQTFDRTIVLDDADYHVRDIGRDIGQMRGYELKAMIAEGRSIMDSEFAREGPYLVLVKRTGEYFRVQGSFDDPATLVLSLSNETGSAKRPIKDERLKAL